MRWFDSYMNAPPSMCLQRNALEILRASTTIHPETVLQFFIPQLLLICVLHLVNIIKHGSINVFRHFVHRRTISEAGE